MLKNISDLNTGDYLVMDGEHNELDYCHVRISTLSGSLPRILRILHKDVNPEYVDVVGIIVKHGAYQVIRVNSKSVTVNVEFESNYGGESYYQKIRLSFDGPLVFVKEMQEVKHVLLEGEVPSNFSALRGMINSGIEQQVPGFLIQRHPTKGALIITQLKSGKSFTAGLYCSSDVIQALSTFCT